MDGLSRMLSKAASKCQIKGFHEGICGVCINHILFVDYTVLFSDLEDESSLQNLLDVVGCFEKVFGNFKKSEFIGVNLDPSFVEDAASKYGCKIGSWPRLPFYGSPKSHSFWLPLLKKLRKDFWLGARPSFPKEGDILFFKPLCLTSLHIIFPCSICLTRWCKWWRDYSETFYGKMTSI